MLRSHAPAPGPRAPCPAVVTVAQRCLALCSGGTWISLTIPCFVGRDPFSRIPPDAIPPSVQSATVALLSETGGHEYLFLLRHRLPIDHRKTARRFKSLHGDGRLGVLGRTLLLLRG